MTGTTLNIRENFSRYKPMFVSSARRILENGRSDALDEAAFPAYAHRNPLISFLFWRRISAVVRYLERRGPFDAVLDFGCGSGVLLPFLSAMSQQVTGYDLDLGPFQKMARAVDFPANIEVHAANDRPIEQLRAGSYNVVTALDVLEHVDNLRETIGILSRLLKPGGILIVSGPTENWAYRIGRRIAGAEFTGDYHVRDIYQIRQTMAELMRVRTIATLFYPVPLFKIYSGTVR